MAEAFNFEDINRKFNEVITALDSIKAQNALEIGDVSRLFNSIGEKLDSISGTADNTEALKLVNDLKKTLEDRYSFINVKFSELESAFKNASKLNDNIVTTPQMKELFDVLSTNLSVFSKQVMAQGDILNEITLRIEALRTDDTDKREIIKTISALKSDLDKFNNGFESIILNVNHNYESMMEQIGNLDPTVEVKSMANSIEDMKSSSDAILSAMQIVDQKQNSLTSSLEEVVSQNTKINANIKALAGQSDFDGLVRKIETSIEIITTLKGALTDANEQSQKAILLHLDKLSSTVTRILTEEDFEIFKTELSALVKEVIESTNVMRGDLLSTTSEFRNLSELMEDLDLKTTFESLRTLIDDTGRGIRASFVEALANTSIEPIKNNTNLLLDKLDLTKSSINENSDKNLSKALDKIESLSNLGDKIREIVTYMPDAIKQSLLSVEDGQRAYVEKSYKNLEQIIESVNIIQNDMADIAEPLKATLISDIKELKDIVISLKAYLSNNEDSNLKFKNLETIIAKVAGDYDVALHAVKDNIIQYLASVKEDCESADIKMNNFAFEFNSLKNELTNAFSEINNTAKFQNDKFNTVCNGISSRFDSVLNTLAVISEQPVVIKDIQNGFEKVQQCMQDILLAISDIKINSISSVNRSVADVDVITDISADGVSSDLLLKFENKINKIKDQLNFMSTDFMENLYNRTESILNDFEPVKKAVLSFVDVDFQNVASALKEQMDAYKSGMQQIMGEVSTEDARGVLNSLFTGLSSLGNKISDMEKSVINAQIDSISEIKQLIEQVKPLMPNVAAMNSEIDENSKKSIESLVEVLDEKTVDIKNEYCTKVEDLKTFVENLIQTKFDDIANKQTAILEKIDNVNSKEEVLTIKNQLNELFDKLTSIQEDITNNKISTTAISEEKLADLNTEDKNVIIEFTRHLAELANLVKLTSEAVDAKITRAMAESSYNFDFESLKSDVEQILSSVQNGVGNISVDNAESKSISDVKNLLETYKSQIVDEITEIKQSIGSFKIDDDLANDIKVVSQKLDLIVINDDVKGEINKSLQDIRNVVKDQQKFLNTVNILETLASLEDISKMKGIQVLEKLNDVISVEKLNSLSKLTLLDKLKNLDCLDDLQKLPKLSAMIDIQEQLKTIITGLDQKMNAVSNTSSTLNLISEEFKNELASAKTAIMKHVLNVFEQLSFVVEGEEIKDFVQEKAQEIINSITSSNSMQQEIKTIKHAIDSLNPLEYKDIEEDMKHVKELTENVENLQNDLNEKLNENLNEKLDNIPNLLSEKLDAIPATVSEKLDSLPAELDARFNDFKQQLNLMRTGSVEDNQDYTYALQDVESDIARLRLALDDIKKVVESNSLKEIADYVNEIVRQVDSMKFNISQDDIFKMRVDIEKITSDVVSISSRTNKLLLASDESAQALNMSMISFKNTISDLYDGLKKLDYSEMSEKLETLSSQVSDTNKQQKNIIDSVAKLSVWADSTEETLSDISETMNKLKKAMPSNESVLDELEVKFAKQQQRIEALEDKIDELLAMSEDKDTSVMSKKLTDIDKQLTRLNKSIERLTSYVDEE